jgi:hypothetical protein
VSPDTAQSLDIFFSGCHHEAGTRHSLDHIDEFALQSEQVRGSDQLWSRLSSCEACEGVVMGSLHGSDHKALEMAPETVVGSCMNVTPRQLATSRHG